MVAVLGIGENGRKTILDIRRGATENATVVGELHITTKNGSPTVMDHSCLTTGERIALTAVLAGPWMLEQERIPPAEAERGRCGGI